MDHQEICTSAAAASSISRSRRLKQIGIALVIGSLLWVGAMLGSDAIGAAGPDERQVPSIAAPTTLPTPTALAQPSASQTPAPAGTSLSSPITQPVTTPPPANGIGLLVPPSSTTTAKVETATPGATAISTSSSKPVVAPLQSSPSAGSGTPSSAPLPTGIASPTIPPPTATARTVTTPTVSAPATATVFATPTAQPTTATPTTATPTSIPATPPPPPVPTLDLSGLQILDNPGIGGNAAIAHAALRHYGEYYRPDGVPWTGWCEMYIGNVMDEAGVAHPRFASAILDAINGPLYRGQAPAGSLVFFDQRANPYGHVGIALGDGTMLSALGGGIVRTVYADWGSYLGWRPYGTTAPTEEPLIIAPLLTMPTSAPPDKDPVASVPVVSAWSAPDAGPSMPPYT